MNRGKSRQVISTKQLFAILVAGVMGNGLVSIARPLTKTAFQDGWISIFLAGLISLVGINIILSLMKRFPQKNFIEISEHVLGKYLGKIPGLIIFSYYLVFATETIRFLADLSSTWLLPKTPIEIIMLSILSLLYYLTRNGIKVMGRFHQLILWLFTFILPIFFVPFFIHGSILNILPVGGGGLVPIVKTVVTGFAAYIGFESLLLLYPYVREDASHKEIVKISNFAVIIVLLLKTFIVFSNIAVFGHLELQFFLAPMLEYFKLIVFPVIERVEFFLFYFWLFIIFSSIVLAYFMATLSIEQLLKIKGYKNIGLFLAFPVYYLTKIPQNVAEVENYFYRWVVIYGNLLIWSTVLIVFGIALFRRRRQAG
ncbi:MAG: endospore germination permease [Halanaerobiales bacterium]|nr:endospore germination permease [Halanaerobiales bacterium]